MIAQYHRILTLLDLFITLVLFAGALLADKIQAYSLSGLLALTGSAGIVLTVSSFVAGLRAKRKE